MKSFENAEWIWAARDGEYCPRADEYAEFVEELELYSPSLTLKISADSNYAAYLNGYLVAFGQYADFPYDKVYDEIDISKWARVGKNVLAIRVWYYGIETTSTYYPGMAGVIYSLASKGVNVCSSRKETLSRYSPTYHHHELKNITGQLGLTFTYDANRADSWCFGDVDENAPLAPSVLTGYNAPMRLRTCKRTELGMNVVARAMNGDNIKPLAKNGRIFDLGKEHVGFITLKFNSLDGKPVQVAFGEHIVDGHVRRDVGGRYFAFTYIPTSGENKYMNPFRRFGCRYIELVPQGDIEDVEVSLISVDYPVEEILPEFAMTPVQKRIYDACVYTLRCCMHEHYEDCPWREQALYTMDSRNQMLAGYYAFGETLFPKANLELIAADNRPDGLLSICYPIKKELAIPSFSLHFIIQSEEYLRYSGDKEFIAKIYPKLKSVISAFVSKIDDDGLIHPIAGKGMWNFYEWQCVLDGESQLGHGMTEEGLPADIVLNSLVAIALRRLAVIEKNVGIESNTLGLADALAERIHEHFFEEERGVYRNRREQSHACKLGNALAILAGAPKGELRAAIADKLTDNSVSSAELAKPGFVTDKLPPATLSMQGFVYDALIDVDREKYRDYILADIEENYIPMLECGNGTVWETVDGESAFSDAGSLCHGWSSIPVYYYHILLGDKNA